MRTPTRTLSIPADLLERVEKYVATSGQGYSTPTDFIKEAIRLRLEDLERQGRMITK